MRRESIVPRRRRPVIEVAVALGLGALLAGGYSVQGCGPQAQSPSLVWDGSAYAVAWAAPENGAVTVYAHRFTEGDFQGAMARRGKAQPSRVLRVESTLSPPEIVHGGDEFLVVVHASDHSLFTVPLDGNGAVAGKARSIARGVQSLCVSPVSLGESFAVAYVGQRDGDRAPALVLARVDRAGNLVATETIGHGAGRCAMASDGRRLVIVQERRKGGAALLDMHTPGSDHAVAATLAIATSGARSGPLRITPYERDWALLHQVDDSGTLRIDVIDDRGRRREARTLRGEVDPASVDMGVNAGGAFVTWLADRKVHVLTASDEQAHVNEAGQPRFAGTRAVGHGRCGATSWTSLGGTYVHVLRWRPCP